MSDLKYTVKVEGVEEVERLERAVDKTNRTLAKKLPSGGTVDSIQRELKKLRGSDAVLNDVKQALAGLDSGFDKVVRSIKESAGALNTSFNREMNTMRQTVSNTSLDIGKQMSENLAKGVAANQAKATAAVKGAAAAARAAMTAEYNKLVNNDGLAQLSREQMDALKMLKDAGATVSKYHSDLLKAQETYLQKSREAGNKLVAERERLDRAERDRILANNETNLRVAREFDKQLEKVQKDRLANELSRKERQLNADRVFSKSLADIENRRILDSQKAVEKNLQVSRQFEQQQELHNAKLLIQKEKAQKALEAVLNRQLQVDRVFNTAAEALDREALEKQLKVDRAFEAAVQSHTAKLEELSQKQIEKQLKADRMFEKAQADHNAKMRSLLKQNQTDRMQATIAAAAMSVPAAMNSAEGSYTKYNPSTGLAGGLVATAVAMEQTERQAKGLDKALQHLTLSGNDTHSMARGLASGFGMLWLTWGNMLPLLAGAALSNGFMQTAKQGMAIGHTLEIIGVIGGNTAEEVSSLTAEMLSLSRHGPHGPKEVADAMQTLSLAGLKANEILAVTRDVLNFSISGTTDLKTAADTLVSVSTAFSMGADGFGRVGDVIAKAAAESKTSVESFSNAMKTASVINAQYGVSLEDTATAIATMSQLGIEGTAAGTALRNMYADLSGRSGQVARILREQGIEMRTATGEFRPMIEVVGQLSDKFATLDGISQKNLMQALLSERGAKGLIEMLRLIQTEAKNMGSGFSNALAEMQSKIEQSYGFTAISAAKMAETAQSQFKMVGSSLKASMYEAYESIEPMLYSLAKQLQEMFNSPEFKEGLTSMVTLVGYAARGLADLTQYVIENKEAIIGLGLAYGATKLAISATLGVMQAKKTWTEASTAATVANTAAVGANAAATGASAAAAGAWLGRLTMIGRLLPGIGTAVTLAAGAWSLYSMFVGDANRETERASNNYTSSVVKNLTDEADRLERLNQLRAEGLSLAEAQAKVDSERNKKEHLKGVDAEYANAQAAEVAAWKRYEDARASGKGFAFGEGNKVISLDSLRKTAEEASKIASDAYRRQSEQMAAIAAPTQRIIEASKVNAELLRKEAQERSKLLRTGDGEFKLGEFGGKSSFERPDFGLDGEIQKLQNYYTQRLGVAKDAYSKEKQLLDARHSANLLSESEYMIQSNSSAIRHEAEQLRILEEATLKYSEAFAQRQAMLQASADKAGSPEARKAYLQQMEKEQNEYMARMEKSVAEYEKVRAESAQRLELVYIKMAGEAHRLLKADEEFWTGKKLEADKLAAAEALEKRYRNINTSIFSNEGALKAQAEAEARVFAEVEKQNSAMREQIKLKRLALELAKRELELAKTKTSDPAVLGMLQGQVTNLESTLATLEAGLKDSTKKGLTYGAEEGFRAFNAQRDEELQKLGMEISEAVYLGITGKGAEAGKALRDILQRELVRKPLMAIIQGTVNGVMGLDGGMGGLAGGVSGGFSGFMSAASSLKNVWSSFSNLSSGAGWVTDISSGMASFGADLWMNGFESLGNTMIDLSSSMATYSSAINTAASALSYAAAFYALTEERYATAIGTAVGTYFFGPIGGTIGGWIGGFIDDMFGSNPHEHAGGVYTTKPDPGNPYDDIKDSDLEGTGFGMTAISGLKEDWDRRRVLLDLGLSDGAAGDFLDRPIKEIDSALEKSITGLLTVYDLLGERATGPLRELDLSAAFAINPISTDQDAYAYLKVFDKLTGNQIYGSEHRDDDLGSDIQLAWDKFNGEIAGVMIQELKAAGLPGWMTDIFDGLGEDITMTGFQEALKAINEIDIMFMALGENMVIFNEISDDMKTSLLRIIGGMDAVNEAATAYYNGFYSEKERYDNAASQMNDAIRRLNIFDDRGGLDVRDGQKAKDLFRQAMEELKAAGDGDTLAKLLALSGAFAEIADTAERLKEEANAANEAAAKARKDAAWANFEAAVDREKAYWKGIEDSAKAAFDKLSDLVKHLRTNADNLYGNVKSTASMSATSGNSLINQVLANVKAGGKIDIDQVDSIKEAVTAAVGGVNSGVYATQYDADRERLLLAGRLTVLGDYAESQMSVEERILNNAKMQLEKLEENLEYWRRMLDGTANQIDATLSVADAIEELRRAILGETAPEEFSNRPTLDNKYPIGPVFGPEGSGQGSTATPTPLSSAQESANRRTLALLGDSNAIQVSKNLQSAYAQYEGTGDIPGLWNAVLAAGGNQHDIAWHYGYDINQLEDVLKEHGLPFYDVGTNYVEGDQLAFLHDGEAVIPKPFNPWAGGESIYAPSSSGGMSEAVERRLEQMQDDDRVQTRALLNSINRLVKVSERWDVDGLPNKREEDKL